MSHGKRNIIVMGETGVGKSSLVNMVIGRDVAETSDGAVGCTFDFAAYDDNKGNRFFDTAGFNESARGTVAAKDAIKKLIALLKSLEDGVNLIIFVIRKGRITESLVKNYTIFANGICQEKVPVILAVNWCQMDADENEWYIENKQYFETNGMHFNKVVCGCFGLNLEKIKPAMHPMIKESYEETNQRLLEVLKSEEYNTKHKFGGWFNWFKRVIREIYNSIASWFGWPKLALYETLKQALIRALGIGEEEATELANDVARQLS